MPHVTTAWHIRLIHSLTQSVRLMLSPGYHDELAESSSPALFLNGGHTSAPPATMQPGSMLIQAFPEKLKACQFERWFACRSLTGNRQTLYAASPSAAPAARPNSFG